MGLNFSFLDNWNLYEDDKKYAEPYIDFFYHQINAEKYLQKMFDNYQFVSRKTFKKQVADFISNLKEELNRYSVTITPDNVFLPIKDKHYHNSIELSRELEQHHAFINNSIDLETIGAIDNIIIIDDYSGSGNTIYELLEKIDSMVASKRIFVSALFATDNAIKFLNSIKLNNNTLFVIKKPIKIEKALFLSENNILTDYEKESYFNTCLELKIKCARGYNEIEALKSFYYFTPNNTLGIFWENTTFNYRPLFGRNNIFSDDIRDYYEENKELKKYYAALKPSLISKIYRFYSVVSMLIILSGEKTAQKLMKASDQKFKSTLKTCLEQKIIKNIDGEYSEGNNFNKYVDSGSFAILRSFSTTFSQDDQITNNLEKLK